MARPPGFLLSPALRRLTGHRAGTRRLAALCRAADEFCHAAAALDADSVARDALTRGFGGAAGPREFRCAGAGLGTSQIWGQALGMPLGLDHAASEIHGTGSTNPRNLSTWQPAADGGSRMSDGVGADVKEKVAVIGSGNWGSVAAKLVAANARKHSDFHDEVRMWVLEETLPSGEKLTNVINDKQENVKYLPNVKLGTNIVADPDLESAVKDATMLVFVTPHQFVQGICNKLKGKISLNAKAISLIKGMEVKPEGPIMLSNLISRQLGIDCSVLMGANIANEVAVEKFSEATLGYRSDRTVADNWVKAFSQPYFQVAACNLSIPVSGVLGVRVELPVDNWQVQDVEGVEMCGTLKNVVAIAAGFVDGLKMGNNSKAAIMRIGLKEMTEFSKLLYPTIQDATFFESCGIADLITTCFGGRNRKVAEAFARSGGERSFNELEAELLGGQKLQGVLTAGEVFEVLKARNLDKSFPLFSTVHLIASGHLPPAAIVEYSDYTPRKDNTKAAQYQ